MRYEQDLQVALRDRLRRLMTVDHGLAGHELVLVTGWIQKQPALRAALEEAALRETDLDFRAFREQFSRRSVSWTSQSEEGRAILIWHLAGYIADQERAGQGQEAVLEYTMIFGMRNLNDSWRKFVETFLAPLFDFLGEVVTLSSSVLYILERYVRRVEWFDREALFARFSADQRNGEEAYNLDLQRFLYLEGNHVTQAKARSASGEADVVSGVDTDDPLVCDGKIFDGTGRGKNYLAKGVNQIVQYAHDYQTGIAYLVIFNITGRTLELPSDGDRGKGFPYIELSGVRVYFVVLRASPPAATASKLGKANPISVSREELVNPDVT